MALSGSVSTNKYSGDIGLKLSWSGTQSIVKNTTTIKWTLTSNGGSSGDWWYAAPITVTIGGKTVLSVTSRFKLYGGGAYRKTGTITVTHNENGTKSVSMSVKAAIYSASVNCTGSKSFTLNTINRYALISSVANFDDESDPTIFFTNPAGTDLTTDLKICMKWQNAGVDQATEYVDVPVEDWEGGSLTLDLDDYRANLRNSCPNSNTLAVTFDLQSTMNSVVYHHTKAATMNIVNANPVSGAVSYYDNNPDVVDDVTHNNQIIIQKQSHLVIETAQSQPQKGASITAYSLNFNGTDYDITSGQSYEFLNIDLAGTYTATVTTTDSRGNTNAAQISITILDWATPTAEYTIERQNGFDEKCDFTVNAHFSPLNNLNSVTITEKHRIKGTQQWSGETTITDGQTKVIILNNTFEYEVELAVTDAFATQTYTAFVGKGIPLFFWDAHKNSISFNEIPDAVNQFKVGGQLKCQSMYVDDISSLYAISKTSGNWKVNEISAVRCGNVVHMRIAMSGNGSSVSAGSNGFVGNITAGPLPALSIKLIAYYNNCPIMMNIEPDGAITARVTATSVTVTTTGTLALTGTFITNN